MQPPGPDREARREQTRAIAAQAFLEGMVRFDQGGAKVLQLSAEMAVRSHEDAIGARAQHRLGFQVADPLQLAAVHAWEEFLSAFYAVLNRYAAVFSLIADQETARALDGVRMKVWLRRIAERFPD